MKSPPPPREDWVIPDGFKPVPIEPSSSEPRRAIAICVLVRSKCDPARGWYLPLRDHAEATVLLGCLADNQGRVWDWLEIWIQNNNQLASSLAAYRQHLNNELLDARWNSMCASFDALNPGGQLFTGWETCHPLPLFLSPALAQSVPAQDTRSGNLWRLCKDDALLESAGLPSYSRSLFRYLCQKEAGPDAQRFIPATDNAPENERTIPWEDAVRDYASLIPLNPQAGLVMARLYHPFDLEEYADLLGGKSAHAIPSGVQDGGSWAVQQFIAEKHRRHPSQLDLRLTPNGRASQFVEVFLLKLQLLHDAITQVRAFTASRKTPFLNLTPQSFRVHLGAPNSTLPPFWTAKCCLEKPGEAFLLPLAGAETQYFVPAADRGPSIYNAEAMQRGAQGRAKVRLRQLLPLEDNRFTLEATLASSERLEFSNHDLIWLHLPAGLQRIELFGHAYPAEGLAKGEIRFRTVPQPFSKETAAALKAAEGTSFSNTRYETLPMMSSPCDLHSLAVLGVRLLLVNSENTLPVATDEVMSLAQELDRFEEPACPIPQRIQELLRKDPRWQSSLGPHRLVHDPLDPARAAQFLPLEIWAQTLAALVTMFPGAMQTGGSQPPNDASGLAPEKVFDQPLFQLDLLLNKTRSLLVVDWRFNRTIHATIKSLLDGLPKEESPDPNRAVSA